MKSYTKYITDGSRYVLIEPSDPLQKLYTDEESNEQQNLLATIQPFYGTCKARKHRTVDIYTTSVMEERF